MDYLWWTKPFRWSSSNSVSCNIEADLGGLRLGWNLWPVECHKCGSGNGLFAALAFCCLLVFPNSCLTYQGGVLDNHFDCSLSDSEKMDSMRLLCCFSWKPLVREAYLFIYHIDRRLPTKSKKTKSKMMEKNDFCVYFFPVIWNLLWTCFQKKKSFNFRMMCLWTSVVNGLVLLSSVVICLQLYMTGCVCVYVWLYAHVYM